MWVKPGPKAEVIARPLGLADGVQYVVGGAGLVDLSPECWGQPDRRLLFVVRDNRQHPAVLDLERAVVDRLGLVCGDHAESHPGSIL
jgi:hypothetical protein